MGFVGFDAIHPACAESGKADIFLTTDDRLLKLAKRVTKKLHIKVENPRADEAVSLFAFGCLLRHVGPTRFLRDARQIGIHVAVPQLRGPERKRLVRRDLVLWPEPGMSCWRSSGVPGKAPAAILQWKRTRDVLPGLYSEKDIAWLREFAEENRGSVGYAVTLGSHRETPSVRCARILTGRPKEDGSWFEGQPRRWGCWCDETLQRACGALQDDLV